MEQLQLALADSRDGIKVLGTGPLPGLYSEAVKLFRDATLYLSAAIASSDSVVANQARTKLAAVRSNIVITPFPDVIVTQLSYANGNFTSTVKNQGTTAPPAGVYVGVGYLVDGVNKTYGSVIGPLAPGASVTIGTKGAPYSIPAGTHTIMAYVDDVNRFAESNETNNKFSKTVSVVPPLPDVIVTQLSYANGIFTSTVKNQGTTATPAGVTIGVGYLVDGVNKTYGSVIGPLAAGASVTIGTKGGPFTIPAGTHAIMAYVDDVNRFAESNKSNNKFSRSINVP